MTSKKSKVTLKNSLSIHDLRRLVDFAIEAYDSGYRPHLYIETLLQNLIERARYAREAEENAQER